jgi:hypothetical protein
MVLRRRRNEAHSSSVVDCFGLGVNGILGSGIFLLPAALQRRAGSHSPLGLVGSGQFVHTDRALLRGGGVAHRSLGRPVPKWLPKPAREQPRLFSHINSRLSGRAARSY